MATTEIIQALKSATAPPGRKAWERHIRVEWGILAPPSGAESTLAGLSLTGPATPGANTLNLSGVSLTGAEAKPGLGDLLTGPLSLGGMSFAGKLDSRPAWLRDQPTVVFSDSFEWYWPDGKKRYMEFEGSLEKDGTGNTAELSVWNLSDATLGRYYEALREVGIGHEGEEMEMTAGFIPYVRVYAGYGDWLPLVFSGKIERLPETSWDNADKVTKFALIGDEESKLPRWRCPGAAGSYFPPGTAMSEIVQRLIDDIGMELGAPLELGLDYPIKSGLSYGPDKPLREALKELAQATDSQMYVVNAKIYFVPVDYGIPTGLTVNKNTGLIWASKPIHYPQWGGTEEINFVALMNPMLSLDCLVEVEDRHFKGTVRIEAVHIKINRDEYYFDCRGVIFDEDAAAKSRADRATAKVAELNKQRDPSVQVPLRVVDNVAVDFTPPEGWIAPKDELRIVPDVATMPYWDSKQRRWVDPLVEGGP